jgi:histidine triad (HIT) family protein
VSTKQWPNNPGNALIVPNDCYENLYDIPDDVLAKIHIFSKRLAIAMKAVYQCDGVSIRQHNEPAGNQDVWHYHLHMFPRYENDDLYVLHKQAKNADDTIRLECAQKLREYFTNNV